MPSTKERFLSLDVFRGLIIAFMVIVTMPGNPETTVPALSLSRWKSVSPADLLFPSYLFCMGCSLFFSVKEWRLEQSKTKVLFKIFRRSLLLILLGLILNWFPFFQFNDWTEKWEMIPFSQLRFWGPLQRIGIVYTLVSLLLLVFDVKTMLAIGIVVLVAYWPALYYFGGKGDFGPFSLRGNLVLKIDQWMIGSDHLDQYSQAIPFEQFGFLSTFPAMANMIAGYLAGRFIFQKKFSFETLTNLLMMGFLFMTLAFIWNYVCPVNANLWTSSYAVQAIGVDLSVIAIIIFIVDKMKYAREANFFRILGRNPLVAFIFASTFTIPLQLVEVQPGVSIMTWMFINVFSYTSAYIGSFLQAALFMMIIWGLCYILDQRKDYIII